MSLVITDENFDSVLKENKHVVVDFWASWCGPCRMVGPLVDELAKDNEDVAVGKMDVMANKDIPSRFSITSIPAILYFKDGELVERLRGAQPKHIMQGVINKIKE